MAEGRIVIDPGHGGTSETGGSSWNNAVSASGVPEKVMTLQLAFRVKRALEQAEGHRIRVYLTRESDKNLGLWERASLAKRRQADLFLSIHFNGFNGSARGVETFVRPESAGNVNYEDDREFAARIQRHVFRAVKARDAGTRNRRVKEMRLGVLNDDALGNTVANHPCRACLLEVEFIDVESVDHLLNTGPVFLDVNDEIAAAIRDAVIEELEA